MSVCERVCARTCVSVSVVVRDFVCGVCVCKRVAQVQTCSQMLCWRFLQEPHVLLLPNPVLHTIVRGGGALAWSYVVANGSSHVSLQEGSANDKGA